MSGSLSAQCFADGGTLSLEDGSNINIICANDGISDAFTPIVDGASGDNFAWVIASAGGNILAVPSGPPFDLEGAGPGACFIWYIAYADGFTGNISVGGNICEYTEDDGCFDLSNHITVNRQTGEDCDVLECNALSSEIALTDGSTSATICVDGTPDPLDIVMSGEFAGQNTTFIITDISGTILGIPGGTGPFDLDGAGPGTCVIWYLAFDDGLQGLAVNQNADDLIGCFDLSNGVVVQRNEAEAGAIALEDGATTATICADGTPDPLTVVMSGDMAGDNSTFFITDAATGEILGVPGNNGPFDLDGAGEGVCDIWYLSAFGDVTGLSVGGNIDDIAGCFDLSNPIVVTRNVGADCDAGFNFTDVVISEVASDGMIEIFNGTAAAIDVSNYWLCNRPTYQRLSAMTLECGDLLLQPGEVVVVSGFSGFDATDAELGLYSSSSFGSSDAIVGYLEWGSAGHGRAGVAIEAGIWEADFFLNAPTTGQSLQFGTNDDNEIEWTMAAPSLCEVNSFTTTTDNDDVSVSLSVFPNPIQGDELNIEVEGMIGEFMQVQVYNINGTQLMSTLMPVSSSTTTIHLPIGPAGTYFLRVVNNGQVVTERFSRF